VVQQPAKKSNGCLIAVIVVLVIFVLVGGGIAAATVFFFHKVGNTVTSAEATANADLSAIPTIPTISIPTVTTPGNTGSAPTSGQVDPNAAKIITSAQTSSGVDSDGNPTDNQTSFDVGDDVYISFDSTGQAGYVQLALYRDGSYDIKSDPLQLTDGEPGGYFPVTVNNPGQFVAALYWCNKSDCSDAALGQLVNFTVS
jgi:hypothetical protein